MNRGHRTINRQLLTACCSLITVLCSLLFVMGCQDPVAFEAGLPDEAIPAGKGAFSLTLDTARTILPVTPNLNDFAVYHLDFTPTSGGSAESTDRTNATLSTLPIYLEPGTYGLVVNAYKDSAKTLLLARGTLDGIVISVGKKTAAPVTLKALLAGTGAFRWAITLPAGVTAAMKVTPGNANGTAQEIIPLIAPNASGSRVLNSGPYSLTFNLEKNGREPLVWEELLYVYQNLESVFNFEFKDAHFADTAYTVTYNYNGGSTSNQNQSVLHGDTVASPATPSRSGYAFAGWYSDNNTFNHQWNFENPVIETFTLYARWVNTGSNTRAVSFDANGGSGAVPPPIIVPAGSGVILPNEINLSKNGYTIGGWNTNASGTGTTYQPNDTFTPAGDTTLYARWDFLLTENIWVDGRCDNGNGVWYSINVTSGTTYYIWWNDSKQGKSDKTLDAAVSAVYHDGTPIFTNVDSGYNEPQQFTADRNGAVHVRVAPYANGAGTFALVYRTSSNTRPAGYTVRFDTNFGNTVTGTVPSKTVQPGSAIIIPDGDGLSRSGYAFTGWNTNSGGTGTSYSAGDSFTPGGDVPLYAIWRFIYTITFNADYSGSGAVPDPVTMLSGSSINLPDGPARSGYTFVCWNTNSNSTGGGTNYNAGSSYSPSGSNANITLYARWIINYTVSFNSNSGNGTVPAQTVTNGSTITLPGGEGLSRNGYIFGGWNSNTYGTGTNYYPGATYTVTGNTTLNARWDRLLTENTWTNGACLDYASTSVWYAFNVTSGTRYYIWWSDSKQGNGGTLDVKVSAVYSDGTSIFTTVDSGYSSAQIFIANRDGTVHVRVEPYSVNNTGTFYIMYNTSGTRPANYTVTFNTNGGTGTAPAAQTAVPGSYIVLPNGNGLSKSGYTFGGWNTEADGTGTNYAGNYFPPGNVTLYARWVCTVTFDLNNGTGTAPAAQTVLPGSSITIPNGDGLSRSGYTFGGWNTDASGTGTNYSAGASYPVTSNITLYARWIINYTVTFNTNGGTGTVPNPITAANGSSITLPNGNGLSSSGRVFVGWYPSGSGTVTTYYPGTTYTVTGDVTLYARWSTPLTENIFVNNDTTSSSGVWYSFNVTSGTTYYLWWSDSKQGSGSQTLDVAVSAVYSDGSAIFTGIDSGWTTPQQFTADRTGAVHVRVAPFASGSGSFAIVYRTSSTRPNSYTVTFNSNYGSGTVPAQIVTAGSSITLPSGPTRTNYNFGGWNTNQNGTGTNYSAGSSYQPSANITLYAKWNAIVYTVTFHLNGGYGTAPDPRTSSAGSSVTLPGQGEMTRSSYVFGGWGTGEGTTTVIYSAGATFVPDRNTTLYAVWYPPCIVTYSVNGGSGTPPAQTTVPRGVTMTIGSVFPAVTRAGCTFAGWSTSNDGSGTVYNTGDSFTPPANATSATLYAVWRYTVTFDGNGGGTPSPNTLTTYVNASVGPLPSGNGLAKSNHTFGGWSTNSDGSGTIYAAGSTISSFTGNRTLFAVWYQNRP